MGGGAGGKTEEVSTGLTQIHVASVALIQSESPMSGGLKETIRH